MQPVDLNIAWPFTDQDDWRDAAKGGSEHLLYSRNTPQPIVAEFEQQMANLEQSEKAISFSSGMAAIYATLFTLCKPGSKVIAFDAIYGGSYSIIKHNLPKWGVTTELFLHSDQERFCAAIAGADVVYLESPSNPMLLQVDIDKICKLAKQAGAIVICDNTVATPYAQNPIKLGADVVVHSATKFLGGHVDALAGAVCCDTVTAKAICEQRELIGSVLAPQSAHLVLRGMQTFELRMQRATQNARQLARLLADHKQVKQVFSADNVALLSFDVGNAAAVRTLLDNIAPLVMASTLGGTQTMLGLPETTSHVECTEQERVALGIPAGLVRVSVGIEPFSVIEQAFTTALAKLG